MTKKRHAHKRTQAVGRTVPVSQSRYEELDLEAKKGASKHVFSLKSKSNFEVVTWGGMFTVV